MIERKFCRDCGTEINEHNGILQYSNVPGKYRTLCKSCKNKLSHEYRKVRLEREREQVKQNIADSKINNVTPPRTFVYLNVPYVPDYGYVRNEGLKHIPSRGM